MEQHLLNEGPLIDDFGNLREVGFAYSLNKIYNKESISKSKWKIKEWDRYYIGNKDRGISLLIADMGYSVLASICLIDFRTKTIQETTSMERLSRDKLSLPRNSSRGTSKYINKKKEIDITFEHLSGKRHIYCHWPKFFEEKDLRADIYLEETTPLSIAVATPFKGNGQFVYHQKKNNLIGTGYAKLGDEFIDFSKDSMGVMEWSRGVWPRKTTVLWSSISAKQNGHYIGWNLANCFGSDKSVTENVLFIDDKSYKFNEVRFDIPMDKRGNDIYDQEWSISTLDGSIDLIFTPNLVRESKFGRPLLKRKQYQVFGTFKGVFRLETEEVVEINDLFGFAQKAINRW